MSGAPNMADVALQALGHDATELATMEELAWLADMSERNGYFVPCPMGGGKWAGLHRFAFTVAIIVGEMHDDYGYSDRFCFDHATVALAALLEWKARNFDGEPIGWHRHPDSGRRRPDGDPKKEYVAF